MKKNEEKVYKFLLELWSYFGKKRKLQFYSLLILTIFTSFAEVISLGTLVPFLAALSNPALISENPLMISLASYFEITSREEFLLLLAIFFCVAAILAGGMRLVQAWANIRLSFLTGADLSANIYMRTLYQPYPVHISRNSSAIINGVSRKAAGVIAGCILPVITILTSSTILLSIMSTLIYINALIAFSAFFGFGLTYILIILITKRRLRNNGVIIARETDIMIKTLQEGLGGIRDILVNASQKVYYDLYRQSVFPSALAQGNIQFIAQSPRFIIESAGMVMIAIIACWVVSEPNGFSNAIPILGTLAFGAQRMLPALQAIYGSLSTLQGSAASLKDVLDLLEQPIEESSQDQINALPFTESIKIENLCFKYNTNQENILSSIDFCIKKGSKVGIIGTTGSGKSTLIDIIMGLLHATEGSVKIDQIILNKKNINAWQKNIAHVPQSIFLTDSTITENIAFGVPKCRIDTTRVELAAKQANISEVIDSLPDRYQTIVGERGVRLSGGQRQRIGIARALYKNANLLILDEATSALDNDTENSIINSIEALGKEITVITVAHRITSLKNCNLIVEIKNGKIKKSGSFEEVVAPRI